jgi:hypothetical protein
MSLQAFFSEQGWSPATSLSVVLDFIEVQSMNAELKEYLQGRVADEQSLADKPPLPLNIDSAMNDYDCRDPDADSLYLCEMGVFDDEDPGTAYDSFELLAVADSPAGAESYAQEWLSNHPVPRFASASFSLMGPPETIALQDYYFQDDNDEWQHVI